MSHERKSSFKKKREIYNLLSVYKSRLRRCFYYVKANLKGEKYPLHNITHSCLKCCVFLSGCTYMFLVPLSKSYTMVNLKVLPTQSCENPLFHVITGIFSLVPQWGNNFIRCDRSYHIIVVVVGHILLQQGKNKCPTPASGYSLIS